MLRLAPTPPGNALLRETGSLQACYPLDLARCRACGHIQLLDIVNRIDVLGRPAAADQASPQRMATAEGFARALARRLALPRESLVVDIGSNDGTFLKVFEDSGMRVQGIEAAVNVAGDAIRGGIATHPGLFSPAIAERIEDSRGRAALVVAHQALAEAEDPFAVLEGVRILLRRDGVFAFSVDALAAVVERGRVDRIDHRSLSYHTVAPLKRFLAACDLELFAVQRVGDRLNGLAQRLGGRHAADGSVEHSIAAEADAGLEDGGAFPPFAARVAHLIAVTSAKVVAARNADARIAAVGAGCGATTWLGQLGAAAAAISFLADDAAERQNHFSPAFDLPIRPLADLMSERPDLILIFDPDEAEGVCSRVVPLIQAGAQVITPGGGVAAGAL
ncbi:MAG: class I SAM-dependent methyltransferase [Rhodospirillales bacterium]|nr:class I SAM-dependent methyltransferase [Rhodospirillales bacterium]